MSTPVISVSTLSIERQQRVILEGLDFEVCSGGCLYVQGDNGSGKSTLLATLAGIRYPLSGQIKLQSNRICYLAHEIAIHPKLTVFEQLLFDPMLALDANTAESMLHLFELHNLRGSYCSQLSQGQKQRVALARVLASDSDIYLLDEPFTACDHRMRDKAITLLIEKLTLGAVVIYTGHQPSKLDALAAQIVNLSSYQPLDVT